jgi:hypothetical protein
LFCLIDLKIGDLKHQDLGQMQMYVNYYDRFIKLEEENKNDWHCTLSRQKRNLGRNYVARRQPTDFCQSLSNGITQQTRITSIANTTHKGISDAIYRYIRKRFSKVHYQLFGNRTQIFETTPTEFDREFCINTKQVLAFIEATQKDAYEMIQKKGERSFLVRLDEKIKELGVIEVLRKGVKHFDKTIELFYRKPSSSYNTKDAARYAANLFSVTQELKYSLSHENRLDLTVFVNGIPVMTCELKNPLSGQYVQNGIRQYQNDRDPKEKMFSFARCMVHFAADTEQVFMCSELKGKASFFIPFNKGLNDGKATPPFGAGNPVNPNGLKTHYLWEEVLSKDSLANIIDKFAQVIEETDEDTGKKKKKMIFPVIINSHR